MEKVFATKRVFAVAMAGVALAAAIAVPQAYGFYYVHNGSESANGGRGVIEVPATIDDSANGGAVKTELLIVPEGATVADVANEFVYSSESKSDSAARHDYSYENIAEKVKAGNYECRVIEADEKQPSASSEYGTGETVTDFSSYVLDRYDNVVFIAKADNAK